MIYFKINIIKYMIGILIHQVERGKMKKKLLIKLIIIPKEVVY